MMQAKISSFFKRHCDPLQSSDQIDGGKGEIFAKNDHPEILVTYKRRDPKPNESISDAKGNQSNNNEMERANEGASNASQQSGSCGKILNKKRSYSQFHLELGQSDFLLHTCSVCGLMYARGDEGDEKVHKTFHKDYYQGVQFKGWRSERVVFKCNNNGNRIVLVLDGDPPAHKYKAQQVTKIIEKELGFGGGMLLHEFCQVYLFISNDRIVGCLIAEPIKTAHKIISSSNPCKVSDENFKQKDTVKEVKRPCSSSLNFGNIKFQREIIRKDSVNRHKMDEWDHGAILCNHEAVPAVCGIRAIWVVPGSRRNRVASKLLDATRKSFCRSHELELCEIAFSSPSSSGKAFASSYSGSKSFLIYKSGDV